MHHPTDRIIHTTAFVTPVVEHWLREIERRKDENTATLKYNDQFSVQKLVTRNVCKKYFTGYSV